MMEWLFYNSSVLQYFDKENGQLHSLQWQLELHTVNDKVSTYCSGSWETFIAAHTSTRANNLKATLVIHYSLKHAMISKYPTQS